MKSKQSRVRVYSLQKPMVQIEGKPYREPCLEMKWVFVDSAEYRRLKNIHVKNKEIESI